MKSHKLMGSYGRYTVYSGHCVVVVRYIIVILHLHILT